MHLRLYDGTVACDIADPDQGSYQKFRVRAGVAGLSSSNQINVGCLHSVLPLLTFLLSSPPRHRIYSYSPLR